MKAITPALLKKFLKAAGDRLAGEWVVIGGTVLPLLGDDHRATIDIDVACVARNQPDQTLRLLEIAEELGLPVEAVNQAGAFFLTRVPGYRNELVELHRGRSATILRPNAFLFLVLKIGRLSESDLLDCRRMLVRVRGGDEPLDVGRARKAVRAELAKAPAGDRRGRLEALAEELERVKVEG